MSDGDFVTIPMLCKHTGRHRWTIAEMLKSAGVRGEPIPTNRRTKRFRRAEANSAMRIHWPDVAPIPHSSRS